MSGTSVTARVTVDPSTPGQPLGAIPRAALVDRIDGPERVVLVVAPPGFGKTEVARQWAHASARPTAWLAVDLLDASPRSFWMTLIRSLRSIDPGIDDEPALLLDERGPGDPLFLDALISQTERSDQSLAVVIDDVWRITDEHVFDGLALLVARVGHLVRFVVISRSDPPFPSAAWRSRGWLAELRVEHLRFDATEAVRAAGELADMDLSAESVIALNERAEGWPIRLHLALMAVAGEHDPEARARALAHSDHLVVDYLTAEVLDQLPEAQRDVLLSLSVTTWFDRELCAGLLGEEALPVVAAMRRRQLFLTTIDGPDGPARFHPLFRTLLESELQWRDPARHESLHRRAAELWQARGDLATAAAHLIAIGDVDAAAALIIPLTLELVDRGDVLTLRQLLTSTLTSMKVQRASQAFDLSVASIFAGDEAAALRWCATGVGLVDGNPNDAIRAETTRATIALMQGALDRAHAHIEAFNRLRANDPTAGGVLERRAATVAARIALLDGRTDDGGEWVAAATDLQTPPMLTEVVVPMLGAWHDLERGDVRQARERAERALRRAEQSGARPHLGVLDAVVLAARCRLAMGDLDNVEDLIDAARQDAALLGWTLPVVRSGLLAAELACLRGDPQIALSVVDELRTRPRLSWTPHLEAWVGTCEATALVAAGRWARARAAIDGLPDRPRTRLLDARLQLARRSSGAVEARLGERADWSLPEQLEAAVLVAVAKRDGECGRALRVALHTGHETGWVSPFLGLGEAVDAPLRRLPLSQLHPALASSLAPARARGSTTSRHLIEPLTAREHSLLELLPTYLSYARMGEELFLSVNTIKSNLKSIYRKLGVASRAEAVAVATSLGVLDEPIRGARDVPATAGQRSPRPAAGRTSRSGS